MSNESIDPEFSSLLRDFLNSDLLPTGSSEFAIADQVAASGLASLDPGQRAVWERDILPIVSKPLREQLAIASIVRRGGRVPRKIDW